MKIAIQKSDLTKLLSRVAPTVSDKTPIPVLKCVLLSASGDALHARATNLVLSASASMPCFVSKPGEAAIPLDWLFDSVKSMPAGEITLEVDKLSATVKAAKRKARGPCLTSDDFPAVHEPAPTGTTLPSADLSAMLGQSSYAQSTDDRAHIACVRLESDGKTVRCTTTDGHRFASSLRATEAAPLIESIPTVAVKAVERLAHEHRESTVTISVTGGEYGHVHFVWPTTTFTVKRGEQGFPKVQVPQSFAHEVVLPRQELIEAIALAKVASGKNKAGTHGIKIALREGVCVISGESADSGSASSEIDCSYAGQDWATGAASEYLTQALAAITDDDVVMKLSAELQPIVFVGAKEPEAYTSLVMPMRL